MQTQAPRRKQASQKPSRRKATSKHMSSVKYGTGRRDRTEETGTHITPLIAKTERQQDMIDSLYRNRFTFAVGPAGTGKTHMALLVAAHMLLRNQVSSIIVIRSPLEAGEKLGYLPGEIEDKIDPYFETVVKLLTQFLGKGYVDCAVRKGNIRLVPFAFLRSGTMDNSFVLIEEAQNTTVSQMKLAFTRVGNNTTYCIAGDDRDQSDLPPGVVSGLTHAVHLFFGVPQVGVVKFGLDDIVRDDMCRTVVKLYRSEKAKNMRLDYVS